MTASLNSARDGNVGHGEAEYANNLTVALLTGMLVVHNAQRTSVVPVFDALRVRYGIDYAGVGILFAS